MMPPTSTPPIRDEEQASFREGVEAFRREPAGGKLKLLTAFFVIAIAWFCVRTVLDQLERRSERRRRR